MRGERGRPALRRDDVLYALLLERARPETLAGVDDLDEMARAAGLLSARLTVPAPAFLPRLGEQAGDWDERLRKDAGELPHGLQARVIGAALATLRDPGGSQPDIMVHGDFHARNILRGIANSPRGWPSTPRDMPAIPRMTAEHS